ncbi:MAG: hypothetical protein KC978_09270, partial [Candidatus Omnitrophica bacterium]|nr:hypothetical protein [Candidatus Omnitrophota bacterium]
MNNKIASPDPELAKSGGRSASLHGTLGHALVFFTAWILITLAGITPRPHLDSLDDVQVGEPSPRTVTAPFTFKFVDQKETERLRSDAEKTVPRTFERVGGVVEGAMEKWDALVEIAQGRSNGLWANENEVTEASQSAKQFWVGLNKEQQNLLSDMAKDPVKTEAVENRMLHTLVDEDILLSQDELRLLQPTASTQAVPWKLKKLDGTMEYNQSGAAVLSVTTAQRLVSRDVADLHFQNTPVAEKLADDLAHAFIRPTLRLDQYKSQLDRQAAKAEIPSVSITVKQNQNIVRKGEEVLQDEYAALVELSTKKQSRAGEITARAMLLAVVLGLFFAFLRRFEPDLYQDLPRTTALFGMAALIVWVGFLVSWASDLNEGVVTPVEYLVPVAAIGILVTFLENSRLGIFSVILATLLVGIQFQWEFS